MTGYTIRQGDCLEIMPTLAPNSIDAIVTDPPYGLGFMGKDWDHGVPGAHFWQEALRVAKPGAHLLAFGGTRTFHRLAVAIEDAGWELRDTIMWVYGSGFPKSLDVSKAIDREAGAARDVVGINGNGRPNRAGMHSHSLAQAQTIGGIVTAPATPAAAQWAGWGTALKPAWEPIIVARKPVEGTVAQNVQRWGTGAINVDGGRVGTEDDLARTHHQDSGIFGSEYQRAQGYRPDWYRKENAKLETQSHPAGRWPANVIHDGSAEVLAGFPVTQVGGAPQGSTNRNLPFGHGAIPTAYHGNDTGSAARFFYCAKASKADRDEGLEGLPERIAMRYSERAQCPLPQQTPAKPVPQRNHHPTVKPTALMRYLVRLVTPPGGLVLDPFMGSGSTGKGAVLEGARFLGIELDADYCAIARARIGCMVADVAFGLFEEAPT